MKKLKVIYNRRRREIRKRLKDFKRLHHAPDERLFEELSFCLFTPQSKALSCDYAVRELKKRGLLMKGGKGSVAKRLKGVRFPNNKASYLIEARGLFRCGTSFDIKSRLNRRNISDTREWLVSNVKGLGYKEASHFLRNIGLGKGLAILDAHILKNLRGYGVIKKIPTSLTRRRYLEIEKKMKGFSEEIDIPLEELDLLFWSKETGIVFK